VEGYAFFLLYSNGTPEENNAVSAGMVARQLYEYMDQKLAEWYLAEGKP